MSAEKPPSLSQIAQVVGLPVSTVSRALHQHPGIPEATRQRVREAASALGYIPNARVSALMAEIKRTAPIAFRGTLAWVTMGSPKMEQPYTIRIRLAAEQRAHALGYSLEMFSLEALPRRRLNSILHARGTQGILVAPLPRSRFHLVLDWNCFAGVAIGNSLRRPMLSRVVNHQYHSVQVALREMRRHGYKRIALCLNRENSARTDHNWLAGALVHRSLLGADIAIVLLGQWQTSRNEILQWLKANQIEAVLSPHEPLLTFLREEGLEIPEKVGFACLDLSTESSCAGIDQRNDQLGTIAVDALVGQILRGETALEALPVALLVEGQWREASTLPARKSGARPLAKTGIGMGAEIAYIP